MKTDAYKPQEEQITNFWESSNPFKHEVDFCFSEKKGYYLARMIVQERRGRVWENITEEDFDSCLERLRLEQGTFTPKIPSAQYREIETFRPLEGSDLLHALVDLAIPDHGDLRDRFHAALVRAERKAVD
jgi:hypothetical protein